MITIKQLEKYKAISDKIKAINDELKSTCSREEDGDLFGLVMVLAHDSSTDDEVAITKCVMGNLSHVGMALGDLIEADRDMQIIAARTLTAIKAKGSPQELLEVVDHIGGHVHQKVMFKE